MDSAADSSLYLSRVECKVWTVDRGAALDNTDRTDVRILGVQQFLTATQSNSN